MIDDCGGKGELEKRINKLQRATDTEWWHHGVEPKSRDEIFEIVGEMRKEFPKPWEIENKDWNKPMEETFKWFKKWLGDSK